jgi:hypothetical protein
MDERETKNALNMIGAWCVFFYGDCIPTDVSDILDAEIEYNWMTRKVTIDIDLKNTP